MPCLDESEYGMIFDLFFIPPPPEFVWLALYADALALARFSSGHRWDTFKDTYSLTYFSVTIEGVEVGFYIGDAATWQPISDWLDEGQPTSPDRCLCDVLKFKANQGGSWPVLWPTGC